MQELRVKNNGKLLEIDGASIAYRDFTGCATDFSEPGKYGFALVIPNQDSAIADVLTDLGLEIKVKPPREDVEGALPFMYIPVKLLYGRIAPNVYLCSGEEDVDGRPISTLLDEEALAVLQSADILDVSLDLNVSTWEFGNRSGKSLYVRNAQFTIAPNRFRK